MPALVEACQDPEIARWTMVPSPYGAEEGTRFLELARERRASGWGAHYLVVDRIADDQAASTPVSPDTPDRSGAAAAESGAQPGSALLGTVALVNIDLEGRTAEVGYWVSASARGRGVASTATGALVDWGFSLGLERIQAHVMAGNEASRRVMDSVGFVEEGVLRSLPAGSCGHGVDRIDIHVYSQIRSDRE